MQLQRTPLRSPLKGQILKTNAEPGEIAGPASPEPAVILADTSRYRVRAFVEEMDAGDVRIGMAAKIRADGPGARECHGRIARLSPRMEDKSLWNDRPAERLDTKTREIWIDLDDPPSVIGLRVNVVIDPSS